MFHNKLSKNIMKRYIYILHHCLNCLESDDKKIIKEAGNIEFSDIIKDPYFNIFICFIEELINQNKLESKHAKLIFVFTKKIEYKYVKKEPFYSFYKRNKQALIFDAKFLEFFLTKDFKNKLFNEDYSRNYNKLNKALLLIDNILPNNLKQNINNKIKYVNINNSYGLINSLTINKCFDLLFLSLNNPNFLIIEQIIHEQAHIKFGKLVETIRYESLFNRQYSAYSPFVEKVRPIGYIANGYFAFLSVLNLYNFYLEKYKFLKKDLEINNINIIKKRIKILTPRLKTAEIILNQIFEKNKLWVNFKNEFKLSYEIPYFISKPNEYVFNSGFSDIQNAEIILGLNTNKISRITIPISQTKNIFEMLPLNTFIFSNEAYVDSNIEDLKNFNNLHTNIGSHINSKNDDTTFVNCYIGKRMSHLKKAVQNDLDDGSGSYFNIPKCCQKYFLANWNEIVKKYKGDFIKYNLLNIKNNQIFKWQSNSIAMYFDAGFTWHFPCNFNCSYTINLSSKRYKELKKINSELAERLIENAKGDFLQLNDNNYIRISSSKKTYTKEDTSSKILKKIKFV